MSRDAVAVGTPALAADISVGAGVGLETVATFLLVLVVLQAVVDPRAPQSVYPFAIGLTITMGILAIGPLAGAALNPSRWFGPARVSEEWSDAAVWIVGPALGAALAWAAHEYVLSRRRTASATAPANRS